MDFSTTEITPKKVRGNDVDFSITEIILRKYVEMTWKFAEIRSSKYQHKIDVEFTSIRRGAPIGILRQTSFASYYQTQKNFD